MTGVCLLGHIVNNCVTDRADLPLSAAQGKALMDLYTVLNTNLNNKLIPQNVYDVKNGTFKNFDEITSTQIAAVYILNDGSDKTPSGRDGILVAFFVSQREWGMQIFADHYPNFYMRICWGGWKEWKKITAN